MRRSSLALRARRIPLSHHTISPPLLVHGKSNRAPLPSTPLHHRHRQNCPELAVRHYFQSISPTSAPLLLLHRPSQATAGPQVAPLPAYGVPQRTTQEQSAADHLDAASRPEQPISASTSTKNRPHVSPLASLGPRPAKSGAHRPGIWPPARSVRPQGLHCFDSTLFRVPNVRFQGPGCKSSFRVTAATSENHYKS
jgi:hypothetical protein